MRDQQPEALLGACACEGAARSMLRGRNAGAEARHKRLPKRQRCNTLGPVGQTVMCSIVLTLRRAGVPTRAS